MRDSLENFSGKDASDGEGTGPVYGWPVGDEARFFFLLRLAEVFYNLDRRSSTFNGWYARKGTYWATFAQAALSLQDLVLTTSMISAGSSAGRKAKRAANRFRGPLRRFFRGDGKSGSIPITRRGALQRIDKCAGNLMTAGRAIDRHDGGEPWSWREHTI